MLDLLNRIPKNILSNIFTFMSHPVADIIRERIIKMIKQRQFIMAHNGITRTLNKRAYERFMKDERVRLNMLLEFNTSGDYT
jgi:hypothetical protein